MRLVGSAAAVLLLALFLSPTRVTNAQRFDGRDIFRFDTFDDEQLWTDRLRLHEAVETVTPATALAVGLKVDVDALTPPMVRAIQSGQLDVNDTGVTLDLLKRDAVVGVIAKVTGNSIRSIGVTCALCHSTVDNSLGKGIGHRLDGWPNLDLDVGKIVALAPGFPDGLREEFRRWGPGRYDPRHHIFDGSNLMILNMPSLPVVIPPAYGLAGVGFETFTGDGHVSYWNAYVGITQMGGRGTFIDQRIGVSVTQTPDVVTPKLPALFEYQMSLRAPAPPNGSFDAVAAQRGRVLFLGAARCGTCHIPPTYTDVSTGANPQIPVLHGATEVGQDPRYAQRSATKQYRSTPLRALWQHPPYFHDGSAANLAAVVDHYNTTLVPPLNLSPAQKTDLVEFLKSL